MKTRHLILLTLVGALMLPTGIINAADKIQQQTQTKDQQQLQEQDKMIYGWQLMTPQERKTHREKMLSLKTEQERIAYREEHHKLMQQRAKEKGMTLPDRPMMRGTGPGAGGGFGNAQGSGKGR